MQNKRGISQTFDPPLSGLEIRKATVFDAFAISEILTSSIKILCSKDHQEDPVKLTTWLSGKDPASIRQELADSRVYYIATTGRTPVGTGALEPETGEIRLLYISPATAGQGFGAALLTHFENILAAAGHRELHLMATQTAAPFYQAHGWVSNGPLSPCCGIQGWPMRKTLAPTP